MHLSHACRQLYIHFANTQEKRFYIPSANSDNVEQKYLQTCSLPGLGREKPPNQIPSLYSPSLCYLITELTAVFLCLGRAMNYGRKDKEPESGIARLQGTKSTPASSGFSTLTLQHRLELQQTCG